MADSILYRIANHTLRVEGDAEVAMLRKMAGFPVFETDETEAEWSIVFGADVQKPEQWNELYDFLFEEQLMDGKFATTGTDYYFSMVPRDNEQPPLLMRYSGGDTVLGTTCCTPDLLRFALWVALGMMAAASKMVLVHSSTIVHQGKAVLFLGESGTGKSTHTRLWLKHIPDAHLLNDDSPVLTIENGEAVVYGSPWSGKTHCYHQRRFPLAAAVRLSQAPYNRIHRLSVVEGFSALHPSFPPALAQDSHYQDLLMALISDVLTTVPVFHLECLPDEAAAHTSHDAIFV